MQYKSGKESTKFSISALEMDLEAGSVGWDHKHKASSCSALCLQFEYICYYATMIWPSLIVAGWRSDDGAKGRLQVTERQCPVYRPLNLCSAPLGQSRPASHIEMNQSWQGLKGLFLQTVLNTSVGFTGLEHRLSDEEVESFLLPVAGQDKVAVIGLRVSDEEVAMIHHQALWHLRKKNLILHATFYFVCVFMSPPADQITLPFAFQSPNLFIQIYSFTLSITIVCLHSYIYKKKLCRIFNNLLR